MRVHSAQVSTLAAFEGAPSFRNSLEFCYAYLSSRIDGGFVPKFRSIG